jgi:nitrogenase molybdenum-iron protein alpha/beta subunit
MLTNITPDSLSGIIFALEGIARTAVLLNGPTGCKFYHSAISDSQMIRQRDFDPLRFPAIWHFGQPRVPCTYLGSRDYVYGSRAKLMEALPYLRGRGDSDLICVVNSPGAALIGDDLRGIAREALPDAHCVTVETPGFSENIFAGYDTAAKALFSQLHIPKKTARPATVNLLGLSIFHRNFQGDLAEITRLLNLCGIRVVCALFAGYGLEAIRSMPEAALNVVLYPEFGLATAQLLEETYGTPYVAPDGPPIGFSATEELIAAVCDKLGCGGAAFEEESGRARARAYTHISRVHSLSGLPKGTKFALEGTYSELYAYTRFFAGYFGMILDSVSVFCPERGERMETYIALLDSLGMSAALKRGLPETEAELVFASGGAIAALKLRKREFTGVEIALPTLGYIDVLPKANLGVSGALLLTEQVLNGLLFH